MKEKSNKLEYFTYESQFMNIVSSNDNYENSTHKNQYTKSILTTPLRRIKRF